MFFQLQKLNMWLSLNTKTTKILKHKDRVQNLKYNNCFYFFNIPEQIEPL